jgi:hypothetical protein
MFSWHLGNKCIKYGFYFFIIKPTDVQWKTPDDGERNCPKYVEFLGKIHFRN